jgi:vacuolar-type H+-ATPase catalytic subunit A/Vma1
MNWLLNVWNVVEPYFMEGFKWFASTGAGVAVGSWIVKKWSKKYEDKQLAETISNNVTSGIVNKDILVSLESVNREQIEAVKTKLVQEFANQFEFIKLQTDVVCNMAKVMLKFKATTEEERKKLLECVNAIEKKQHKTLTTEVKSDPVIIKIEPVVEKEVNEETLF